jgi:hypothetical protein
MTKRTCTIATARTSQPTMTEGNPFKIGFLRSFRPFGPPICPVVDAAGRVPSTYIVTPRAARHLGSAIARSAGRDARKRGAKRLPLARASTLAFRSIPDSTRCLKSVAPTFRAWRANGIQVETALPHRTFCTSYCSRNSSRGVHLGSAADCGKAQCIRCSRVFDEHR